MENGAALGITTPHSKIANITHVLKPLPLTHTHYTHLHGAVHTGVGVCLGERVVGNHHQELEKTRKVQTRAAARHRRGQAQVALWGVVKRL